MWAGPKLALNSILINQSSSVIIIRERANNNKTDREEEKVKFLAGELEIIVEEYFRFLGSPRMINSFPNLTGTPALELIHLDRINVAEVPHNLCSLAPRLHTLRLRSNKLKQLPQLQNCSELVQL